jgi:hypothetical protein
MTQMQVVAKHILQYGAITRNTAIGMYQISRLAAVANRLAKQGVPITSEPVFKGGKVVDWKYAYRQDYLDRIRALVKANALLEQHGWKKAN